MDDFLHIRGERGRQPEQVLPESERQALERELELVEQRFQSQWSSRFIRQLVVDNG